MKRTLILIIGIIISVACFALSFRGVEAEELKAGFLQANYFTLPLMLALLFAFYWLKAIRWKWLMSPFLPVTTRELFGPLLIGFAANNILPAHLGEFIRVFVIRRRYGAPVSAVLSTVVLERIFDVLAILALFGLGLAFSDDLPESYQKSALVVGGGAVFVVFCVVIYLIWTDWFLKLVTLTCEWLPFVPKSLTEKVVGMLRSGASGLSALRSGSRVFVIAVTSLIQWFLNGLIAYVALRAFGIPVTPATGLVVTGVTAFGVTIPSTPGYFGVIQMCFQISMRSQGNAAEIPNIESLVLGASLYYHMSMYIPVTALGMYFLQQSGLHLKELQKAAEKDT
ncbi:MAG: flippase-like domain-containing protein [Planctomyces sp.]|nr:flippase-like domain-containing protein [Planctomyces sp.]